MKIHLSEGQSFPWGYQIRADYTADDGRVFNEVLEFRTKPIRTEIGTGIVLEWESPREVDISKAVADRELRLTKLIQDMNVEATRPISCCPVCGTILPLGSELIPRN